MISRSLLVLAVGSPEFGLFRYFLRLEVPDQALDLLGQVSHPDLERKTLLESCLAGRNLLLLPGVVLLLDDALCNFKELNGHQVLLVLCAPPEDLGLGLLGRQTVLQLAPV